MIGQELHGLGQKVRDLEIRMAEVEKANARLEDAALITARAPSKRFQVTGTRCMRLCAAKRRSYRSARLIATTLRAGRVETAQRCSHVRITGKGMLL